MTIFNTRITGNKDVVYPDLSVSNDGVLNKLIKGRKLDSKKLYQTLLDSMSKKTLEPKSRDVFCDNLDNLCERGDLTTSQVIVLKDKAEKLTK